MHELSVMNQILGSVIAEAEKNGATEVTKIFLEIGELTFLGEEQLGFAFDVLKNGVLLENPSLMNPNRNCGSSASSSILKNAELIVKKKKAAIQCVCGYEGDLKYSETPDFHQIFPLISCPVCNAVPNITTGKECIIRNITMEVPDVQVS